MTGTEWRVKHVEVIPPYGLKLWFEDGIIKTYDMSGKLDYPCFRALRDEGLFRRARVYASTVVWNDEIDIAPEELYINGETVRE